MKVSSRPVSFLGLSLATALTLLSFSLSLSSSSSISGVYAFPVRSSQPLHSLSQSQPSRNQHTQVRVRRRSTKDALAPPNGNKKQKSPPPAQSKTQQQQKQNKKRPSPSNSKNINARRQQQKQKKQKSLVKVKAAAAEEQRQERRGRPAPAPAHPPHSPSPRSLSPVDGLLSKKSTSPTSTTTTTSPSTIEFNKPLLIVPPPRSVWHAGSVQLVKWSKTYARQLPKDTTVDIILADAKTNKKIVSLKRFIPFRKGSAQVWVPSKIPDNEDASASYVLVLDLFHGKSQKAVTVESAKASATAAASSLAALLSSSSSEKNRPASTSRTSTTTESDGSGAERAADVPEKITGGSSTSSKKSLPSVLRRSDINIYKRAVPSPPSSSSSSSSVATSTSATTTRENHRITPPAPLADGARADVPSPQPYIGHHHNDDLDTFDPDTINRAPYYNLDNYLRQEFPNVIQPIELEHSFGVHQKVYSRAPYTLEWKIPTRAAELLEYTATRLRLLANKDIDWSQYQSIRDNNITYQAKLHVELIRDGGPGPGAIESVAVLARNVPAETKFQYLQIYDHVEPAFYRLRVQMLVVEVDDTPAGRRSRKNSAMGNGGEMEDPMLDGWDFAKGAQIIDRYESITRKFWVSAGAL